MGNPEIYKKGFTKENPPTPEIIEKRSETRRRQGQFRLKALTALENEFLIVNKSKIVKFVDKFENEIKSPDLDKIHAVYYKQETYDTIIQRMISDAAKGDRHARRQIIELAQGYREAEAEAQDSIKDFLDGITVSSPQIEGEAIDYETLDRTVD